jgi:hypothetical protein
LLGGAALGEQLGAGAAGAGEVAMRSELGERRWWRKLLARVGNRAGIARGSSKQTQGELRRSEQEDGEQCGGARRR